MTEKNGFSVVAATSVTQRFSTPGSSASCWALVKRCTSSTNSTVSCPPRASSARAPSMAARTSLTPAATAETSTNRRSGLLADDRGDGRLAGAGRSPEQQRHRLVALDQLAQRRPGGPQLLLPDELVERARPHPHGQRRRGVRVGAERPGAGHLAGRDPGAGCPAPGISNRPSTPVRSPTPSVRSSDPRRLLSLEVVPGLLVARAGELRRWSAWRRATGLPWSSTPSRSVVTGRTGCEPSSPAKWQATLCRLPICSSGGSTFAQISWANGQRVRNRQPDGGLIGLGTSPSSRIRSRRPPIAACFTSGTAESSACV